MTYLRGCFIGLALLFSCVSAFAEIAKIGIVDLQKIMQTSNQMKTIQQKLEKDFKPRRDKLVSMEETLKKDMEKFKRESTVMSQTQKKEVEKKIINSQQTFEREGQQYQQELSSAHNEAMEALYGRIRKAINKVAEAEKYDLILQKDAVPFSIAKLEVTEYVMKEIEKKLDESPVVRDCVMSEVNIAKIFSLLPHRYPLILIDRVLDYKVYDYLHAIKNVTINEPYFVGHFPENPIMPGVLMLEALAQAGAILSNLSRVPAENHSFLYFFAGIDKARFKQVVTPGDQLNLKVKLIAEKRNFWRIQGEAFVGENLACSAELMSASQEIKRDR